MSNLSRLGRLSITLISIALFISYLLLRDCRSFTVAFVVAILAGVCAVVLAVLIDSRPWRKWATGRKLA